LMKHLFQLFQESQSRGGDEGLFKGLRGLKSLSEADFAKICREFHILDRYRGAMTRTLGSPKQLRAKKELIFHFKKEPVIKVYEPQPMSDTAKKVTQLALHHWWNNMKGLRGRKKLRIYIQGSILGKIGKAQTAKAFEEWHVIIMTKKLYDKREELRAIFGRDVVKRIFKCWVDFVFEEVDAPPTAGMSTTEMQARPRMLRRRVHGAGENTGQGSPVRAESGTSPDRYGHHEDHGPSSPAIVKFPEIPSAVSPQAHSSMKNLIAPGDAGHLPSPPAHKRVQHSGASRNFPSPRLTSMKHDGSIKHSSDRLLLHEDRGVLGRLSR